MDYVVRFAIVTEADENQRVDNYLIKKLKGVPKSHIYKIIRSGSVRINKKRVTPTTKLQLGDEIRIPPVRTASEKQHNVSENMLNVIKKTIIFENPNFMVFNKPTGLAVHGGTGNNLGLIEMVRQLGVDYKNAELVHRIDRDTSGCLLVAKKRSTLKALQNLIADHKLKKIYWAVLSKPWKFKKHHNVMLPLLKRHLPSGEWIVNINNSGKSAETSFNLLKNLNQHALVEVTPKTGRTHQIRVHAQALDNPILGDEKYHGLPATRMFLHAYSLAFYLDDKQYIFEAPLDENFEKLINNG